MEMIKGGENHWFAMRATYHQELKLQRWLSSMGVESFVPMEYRTITKGGRSERRLVSMLSNYIFVHTTHRRICDIKSEIPYLRYVMDLRHQKIVVPEDQMREFIRICSSHSEDLLYLSAEDAGIKAGERVRVLGGRFEGARGLFVKVAGRRNRRFVVAIDGVIAVSVLVDAKMVERIEE